MGGSVAVHVAARKAISSLAGLVVIDVVEVWLQNIISPVLSVFFLLGNQHCADSNNDFREQLWLH